MTISGLKMQLQPSKKSNELHVLKFTEGVPGITLPSGLAASWAELHHRQKGIQSVSSATIYKTYKAKVSDREPLEHHLKR